MKILIASENPVKKNATEEAFSKFFENVEVLGASIKSGVPAQPFDKETFLGARNRVINLFHHASKNGLNDVEYFVGIEGGVEKRFDRWFGFGVVCISDKDKNYGYGITPYFELPKKVIVELSKGKELGKIIDGLSNEIETKRKGGAIGYLTGGVYNRKNLYVNGVIMALVPFLNKEIYFGNE